MREKEWKIRELDERIRRIDVAIDGTVKGSWQRILEESQKARLERKRGKLLGHFAY